MSADVMDALDDDETRRLRTLIADKALCAAMFRMRTAFHMERRDFALLVTDDERARFNVGRWDGMFLGLACA